MAERHKRGITLGPVMVSLILPGLGQMAMGKKALGWAFMISALSSMATGLYLFVTGYIGYMDLVLNFDVYSATPNPWEVMRLKEILTFFGLAIVIHLFSILHAAFASRK